MFSLFKFKGGVKPQTHKAESAGAPIGQTPLPAQLIVPLHQSIGGFAHRRGRPLDFRRRTRAHFWPRAGR